MEFFNSSLFSEEFLLTLINLYDVNTLMTISYHATTILISNSVNNNKTFRTVLVTLSDRQVFVLGIHEHRISSQYGNC